MSIHYSLIGATLIMITSCNEPKSESDDKSSSFDCSTYQEVKKDVFNDSSIIYQNMGIMQQFDGNYDSAVYYFDLAIKADSSIHVAHTNKGNVLLRLGDKKNAIIEFKRVVELKAKIPESHMFLGNLYDYLGYKQEATSEYDIAIELFTERIHCSKNKRQIEGSKVERAMLYMFNNQEEKGRREFAELKEQNKNDAMMQNMIEHQMNLDKKQLFRDLFE